MEDGCEGARLGCSGPVPTYSFVCCVVQSWGVVTNNESWGVCYLSSYCICHHRACKIIWGNLIWVWGICERYAHRLILYLVLVNICVLSESCCCLVWLQPSHVVQGNFCCWKFGSHELVSRSGVSYDFTVEVLCWRGRRSCGINF